MRTTLACGRCILVAAVLLPLGGCGGCGLTVTTKGPKWEAAIQQIQRQVLREIYFHQTGPIVVASAVGSTASSNGYSPLSALATEAAWRAMLETELNRPHDAAAGASLVARFAAPDWGAVYALGTFGNLSEHGQIFGRQHLPTILGAPEQIKDIEVEERTFVVPIRFR